MKAIIIIFLLHFLYFDICLSKEINEKIIGIPICSEENSTSLNNAFDDDYTTEFQSSSEFNSWIGMELPFSYKITQIGWAQKSKDKSKYLLGIFEGANDPTFIDAFPLFMINEEGKTGEMNYIYVDAQKTFKYIRYIGPDKSYSVISGFEVYGVKNEEENKEKEEEKEEEDKMYQPTNIPLIIIHTENSESPNEKKNKVNCYISIINNGKINIISIGTIKLRGNSTLRTEKKSFNIHFSSKVNILDFPSKAKKWVLLANHMDKTLIRNLVAFKVSSLFEMNYTPICKSVDVMLNGVFQGNYIFCDKIEVGENRVDITEMDESCIEEPEISGGYLIEVGGGGWGKGGRTKTIKGINYSINYPDQEDITLEQIEYIKAKFNSIENEIYNGITENIDIDSFTKHFLVEEYCANVDCIHGNYFLIKEREDEKLYYGPVWDFDLSQDNHYFLYPTNPKVKFTYKFSNPAGTLRDFVIHLLNNEIVLKAIKDKWKDLTNTLNITKIILDFIDKQTNIISESQKLNFLKWDILDKKVMFDNKGRGTYEAEIEVLKEFISGRVDTLTKIINNSTTTNVGEGIERRNGGGMGGWNRDKQ